MTYKVKVRYNAYAKAFTVGEIIEVTEWNEYWWNTEDRGIIRKDWCELHPKPAPIWPVDPGLRWWHVKRFVLALIIAGSFCQLHAQDSTWGKSTDSTWNFQVDTMRSYMWFGYYDSAKELGRYDISDDKWIISDTLGLIRYMYKRMRQIQEDQSNRELWYEKRLELMFQIMQIEPEAATLKVGAYDKFQQLSKKLMYLTRHPPKSKP